MTKTSEAQRQAIYARKFVNELATPKDLDELEQRIQARRAEMNN